MSLKRNDLFDTIKPIISVDEYEPKSGTIDEIIVVGFYADDDQPAKDLNVFLSRGHLDILDTDVSPNPDFDGNYLVFVEFKRDEKFFDTFYELVKEVENLSGDQKWMVQTPDIKDAIPYKSKSLKAAIVTDQTKHDAYREDTLESFFRDASIDNVKVIEERSATYPFMEKIVSVSDYVLESSIKVVAFGKSEMLNEHYRLKEMPVNLFAQSHTVRKLRGILGEGWHVTDLGEKIAVSNDWSENILLAQVI